MRNIKTLIKPLLLLSLCAASASLSAETLSIINQPENSADGVLRPERGMQMQQVETNYGSPLSINDAVGEPPITSWVYEKYTVYFEGEYVIHAATHH
ncbi:MAG: hypothetical protein KAT25_08140 [Sulfuriflexus sp.]|nr:hypothetical protein [Sulfuriflexus sp.]